MQKDNNKDDADDEFIKSEDPVYFMFYHRESYESLPVVQCFLLRCGDRVTSELFFLV